ncbi:MAG: U32 family peptidase [Bacillota bacterium]
MELLAPAGNLEKLENTIRFGADAVYCAAGAYSLRAAQTSFSLAELKQGLRFARAHGRKLYLAMNIFAFDRDLDGMIAYLEQAVRLGIDAVIISDPGLLHRINRRGINVRIHLSTQANTTNSDSVRFWQQQGVHRVILARELSLAQIGAIRSSVPGMELEAFVHGAMCIAYSGRCLLSQFMTGRSANRGDCTHPCRWEYHLRETTRREAQTISEDGRGTYILNSRDLCMIEHLPELAAAGVDSIKVEGRMKSAYYVAAVTRVYRAALDSLAGGHYAYRPEWLAELKKVSHRPYTTGFYFPEENAATEYTAGAAPLEGCAFIGTVEEHNQETNMLKVLGRNHFAVGDTVEILDPDRPGIVEFTIGRIINETGEELKAAHNSYVVHIPLAGEHAPAVGRHAILRKKSVHPE